jgi:hypothetical protein
MAAIKSNCGHAVLLVFLGLSAAGCETTNRESSLALDANYQAVASVTRPSRDSSETKQTPNAGDRYFIEFRSRHAFTYGHSFVVFGRLNSEGKMVDPEVAGLAPKSDDPNVYMAGHVIPVPSSTGWTDGDLEPEYISAYWRVMLSEEEYRTVSARIRKLQANSPLWHAALYNCNMFVGKIARSMGYKTPFHWIVPQKYITSLREMNGGPGAIGWTRPSETPRSTINGDVG